MLRPCRVSAFAAEVNVLVLPLRRGRVLGVGTPPLGRGADATAAGLIAPRRRWSRTWLVTSAGRASCVCLACSFATGQLQVDPIQDLVGRLQRQRQLLVGRLLVPGACLLGASRLESEDGRADTTIAPLALSPVGRLLERVVFGASLVDDAAAVDQAL